MVGGVIAARRAVASVTRCVLLMVHTPARRSWLDPTPALRGSQSLNASAVATGRALPWYAIALEMPQPQDADSGTSVAASNCAMRVRLTRKLADEIDGIDLAPHQVGDVIDLSARNGRLLIAERWGIAERRVEGAPTVLAFRRQLDLGQHPLYSEASG